MKFALLSILFISTPLSVIAKCELSGHGFHCNETDLSRFWQEFFRNMYEEDSIAVLDTIHIEDSVVGVLKYFPGHFDSQQDKYKLRNLTITNSSLEQVYEGALENCGSLRILDLSQNKLINITFVKFLPRLITHLYLKDNKISYVDDVFQYLDSLMFLDLSHNRIEIVDTANVGKIMELNFSYNNVNTVVTKTTDLMYCDQTKIDLSHNKIIEYDETLLDICVGFLDISYNNLSTLVLNKDKQVLNVRGNKHLTTVNGRAVISHLDMSSSNNVFLTATTPDIFISKALVVKKNNISAISKILLIKLNSYSNFKVDISNSSVTNIMPYCFKGIKIELLNLSLNNIEVLQIAMFSSSNIDTIDLSYSNINHIEQNAFASARLGTLILKGNELTDVRNSFSNALITDTLDLSFNPLGILRNSTFATMSRLQVLILMHCDITVIQSYSFLGLKNLQALNLNYNKLNILDSYVFSDIPLVNLVVGRVRVIYSKCFSNMEKIMTIDLSEKGIVTLESHSFYNLPRAEVVSLRNNFISLIPMNLFVKLENLKEVYLDGNSITTLNSFPNYIRSTFLSISFNGSFASSSGEELNTKLQHLVIKSSSLLSLKNNSFLGLYALKRLSFENSYVKMIESEALSNLFGLEYLDSQNLFKHIRIIRKNMFTDLKRLPILNLSSLSLESLESNAFVGLSKLDVLLLNNNNITQILEDTFLGLKNVRYLYLAYSNIKILKINAFRGMKSLQILDLSSNKLKEIENDVFFEGLHYLSELNLANNNIVTLCNYSFRGLNSLTRLNLQRNLIKEIPVGVFQYLPALTSLNLSDNVVEVFKIGSLSNLKMLSNLDISNNRINTLEIDIFLSLRHLESLKFDGNHLKQFNFTKLFKSIRHVKYVGISNNKWKCDTLSVIIEILNINNVDYTPEYPVYNDDNIDGVACIDICKFIYCSHKYVYEASHSY